MKEKIMLMEELQSIYAANYKVTIWITDGNGEMISEPKGENRLCDMLLHEQEHQMNIPINKDNQEEWGTSRPIFLDVLPGI